MSRATYRFAETRRNLLWGFGVLTLLTWILGVAIPKYVPISFQLPITKSAEPGAWTINNEPNSVTFGDDGISVSLDSHANSFASLEFAPHLLAHEVDCGIRIGGDVSYNISTNQNRSTLGGAIFLIEYSDEPKFSRQLFQQRYMHGRAGTERWSKVAFPNQDAQKLKLRIGLGQNAGTISLKNLTIQLIKHSPSYQWIFFGTIAAWFVFGLRVSYYFVETGNGLLLCLPAALSLTIGIGVLLPGDSLSFFLQPLNVVMHKFGLTNPDWLPIEFSAGKLGHVLGFAALALVALLMRTRLNLSGLQMASVFLLLALATEGLQLFLPDRSTQFLDVIFDGVGVLIGMIGYAVWMLLTQILWAIFSRSGNEINEPKESDIAASKAS